MRGRKRIEEALKESEERYRAVVEQSVEAIYLYDAETMQVLESNAAFVKMIGYTQEELMGMRIYDFIDHDVDDIDLNVRRSVEAGRRYIGERRYRCKDGSVMIVDTSASVISYGGKTAICAVSRDVTERREIEEALKESEERFRALVQNASDLITILEADGTVRYDSPAVERMLGYEPDERVGTSAFDYIHPEEVSPVKRTFSEAVDEYGVQPPVEFRLRHKDGSWRHIEATRSNLLDEPAVRGVVSNSRDVTERKEAERALRESEARFRAVFDRAAIGMALVNAEGRLMESNPALQEMLGYSDELLRGMHFADLTHPEDVVADAARFEELVAGDIDRFRLEKRYVRKDGSHVWVNLTVSLVREASGEPRYFISVVEDISERKRIVEERDLLLVREPLARAEAVAARRRLALLAAAGPALAASLDYEETLRRATRLVVPDLADWCLLDIAEEDGRVHQLAAAHADPEKEDLLRQLGELRSFGEEDPGSTAQVLRTGRSVLLPGLPDWSFYEREMGFGEHAEVL